MKNEGIHWRDISGETGEGIDKGSADRTGRNALENGESSAYYQRCTARIREQDKVIWKMRTDTALSKLDEDILMIDST